MEYVQENKIKTNIKMKVSLEQSIKIQEICFANGIIWTHKVKQLTNLHLPYLYICDIEGIYATLDVECFNDHKEYEEMDADLFIRTNGTCEEISDEGLSKIKAAFQGKPIEYLQEKVINLHKQINKDRIIIKNQKEELHKLNIKLQKCITLEEHRSIVDKLNKENIEMGRLVNLNASALVLVGQTKDLTMQKIEEQAKEIEKLKAVIEYLESKVK